MSSIKLDLKRFKHHKSDKDTTTLIHEKDGHMITLANKALSSANRDQLDALAKASEHKSKDESPKKMAQGGEVEDPNLTFQQMTDPTYIKTFTPEEIQADKEKRLQEEMAKIQAPGDYTGQDPMLVQKAALNTMASDEKSKEAELLAAAAVEKDKQAQIAELDAMRTQQGLKPLSTPTPQVNDLPHLPGAPAPTSEATITPSVSASAVPQYKNAEDMMQKGLQHSLAGVNAEATAKSALGKDQTDILQKQIEDQHTAQNEYKTQYAALEQERQAHMQDIKDGYIDPNKYWTGDPKTGEGGHSKIAAAIGMIIAGFNPAGTPNAAINFLNKQMDMNLDAQAKNLSSKNNLLAENLKQFGNLKDATTMTRLMQADIVQNQLLQAAAKATTPMAAAAAQKAAGEIELKYAPEFQKFAGQRTIGALKQQAQQDPSKMSAYFTALDAADPTGKLRKDAEERSIPGVGFASSLEGAKGMREMGTTVNTVKQSIARLKEISKKPGKSLNTKDIAEAETIRNMLIGQLRVPITGPGAMSEGEREILAKTIPDVTAIMSLDSSNLKRLDTLESKIINQYKNQAQINGLDPNNIPDMEEIKKFNGVNYKKGPKGWHKIK